ncbi:MAG: hypothetical protein KDC91_01995 [Flavobacteriaceae bacterium]|nr:hypothetical protein [Flavobacteriaceae bacterium]
MSTLVSILSALVLNLLHAGELPKVTESTSPIEQKVCDAGLQQLNPHYLITRDELLSQLNEKTI